ncbi:MAG: hypothetical protein RR100_22195 [Comamonas sp.]
MLQLTPEQFAKLCLPDADEFVPQLAAEIRQDYPSAVSERSDSELQAEVRESHQYAVNQLHITHLPTLVKWVKADVVWARGLRNQAITSAWFSATTHPNVTAADLLALLASNTLAD